MANIWKGLIVSKSKLDRQRKQRVASISSRPNFIAEFAVDFVDCTVDAEVSDELREDLAVELANHFTITGDDFIDRFLEERNLVFNGVESVDGAVQSEESQAGTPGGSTTGGSTVSAEETSRGSSMVGRPGQRGGLQGQAPNCPV